MSEDTDTGSVEVTDTTPTYAGTRSVTATIAEQIAASAPSVKESVINTLVAKETNRRAEIIVQALTKIDSEKKGLFRLKADIVSYNEDGSIKDSSFSKAQFEARKKATESLTKLEKAVEKALETGQYTDLSNILGNKEQ